MGEGDKEGERHPGRELASRAREAVDKARGAPAPRSALARWRPKAPGRSECGRTWGGLQARE